MLTNEHEPFAGTCQFHIFYSLNFLLCEFRIRHPNLLSSFHVYFSFPFHSHISSDNIPSSRDMQMTTLDLTCESFNLSFHVMLTGQVSGKVQALSLGVKISVFGFVRYELYFVITC